MRHAGLPRAADMHADFLEGAFLEQRAKPFAGGQFAVGMLFGGAVWPATGANALFALLQGRDAVLGRLDMDHHNLGL